MISFIDCLSRPKNITSINRSSKASTEWYNLISRDAPGGVRGIARFPGAASLRAALFEFPAFAGERYCARNGRMLAGLGLRAGRRRHVRDNEAHALSFDLDQRLRVFVEVFGDAVVADQVVVADRIEQVLGDIGGVAGDVHVLLDDHRLVPPHHPALDQTRAPARGKTPP